MSGACQPFDLDWEVPLWAICDTRAAPCGRIKTGPQGHPLAGAPGGNYKVELAMRLRLPPATPCGGLSSQETKLT